MLKPLVCLMDQNDAHVSRALAQGVASSQCSSSMFSGGGLFGAPGKPAGALSAPSKGMTLQQWLSHPHTDDRSKVRCTFRSFALTSDFDLLLSTRGMHVGSGRAVQEAAAVQGAARLSCR